MSVLFSPFLLQHSLFCAPTSFKVFHGTILSTVLCICLLSCRVEAGFSAEVCDSMDPTDSSSEVASPVLVPSKQDSPVTIEVDSSFYRKNSHIRVTLSGGSFSKFILQARKLGNLESLTPKRLGRFVEPLPDETEFLACDEDNPKSVVTHSVENTSKSDLSFLWQAPDTDGGTFEFLATIVEGTEYWPMIKSTGINFRMFPADLSDCGKSVGCFVQKVKLEDCFEGGCKIVVKSEVTDDGKLATIIMGRRTTKRGYVGLAFSDNKDKMEDIIMMACIKNDEDINVKAFFLKDRYSGFTNITSYRISPVKYEVYDKMMWCKFQFQVETLISSDRDLTRPRYQLYMSGPLNKTNGPMLPEDKISASDNSMHLNATKYYNIIKYSTDESSLILFSTILCIQSLFLSLFL